MFYALIIHTFFGFVKGFSEYFFVKSPSLDKIIDIYK